MQSYNRTKKYGGFPSRTRRINLLSYDCFFTQQHNIWTWQLNAWNISAGVNNESLLCFKVQNSRNMTKYLKKIKNEETSVERTSMSERKKGENVADDRQIKWLSRIHSQESFSLIKRSKWWPILLVIQSLTFSSLSLSFQRNLPEK